jgi:protein SCO1/2
MPFLGLARSPTILSGRTRSGPFSVKVVLLAISICSILGTHGSLQLPSFTSAYSQEVPDELKGIEIKEHMGEQVSIESLRFRDETGKEVLLGDYFQKGRPVLLSLVYYQCPNLCNFMLNGLVNGLKTLDWTPGEKFEIVSVSIEPQETPELAAQKKASYMESYGRPKGASGWHFLTGEDSQIRKLASQVGFGYRYDKREKQYAHGSVIFALTPEGIISRYLYGIEFFSKDLKLALLEASHGKVGTVVERFLLFCYRYDPQTRRYSVYLTRLMQVSGAITVVLLGGYLGFFWRRQRKGALL